MSTEEQTDRHFQYLFLNAAEVDAKPVGFASVSKTELQRQLHDPRVLGAKDLPKLRTITRRDDEIGSRSRTEAVGQVEGFRSQFESFPFLNTENTR